MAVIATLDNTLGVLFIGNIFVAFLYGVTTLQTYTYYNSESKTDRPILKFLVALLWVFDTIHLLLTSHTVYTYAVSHFGDVSALLVPTWSVVAFLGLTSVSDAIVRGIFCFRIWKLSGRSLLLVLSNAFFSVVLLVQEIVLTILYSHETNYRDLKSQEWLSTLVLAIGAATDLYIALTLTCLLLRYRSDFRRTRNVIRTLILYVVSTGALTSMCMLGSLIAFIVADGTYLFIAFIFPLSKLALNSLLATLNIRKSLREHMENRTITLASCSA